MCVMINMIGFAQCIITRVSLSCLNLSQEIFFSCRSTLHLACLVVWISAAVTGCEVGIDINLLICVLPPLPFTTDAFIKRSLY